MESFYQAIDRFDIILGSGSPRRHQLLTALGVRHRVVVRQVDESFPGDLKREAIALHLAKKKAGAFDDLLLTDKSLVITADTIVCLDDRLLGKPGNREEAVRILETLSGKRHEVFTGVCITSSKKQESFVESSHVSFKPLTREEIEYYIDTYEPYDKAGAYGVQDWFGLTAIEKIEGSYQNVMGLPVKPLYEKLPVFF
jgi:septum formation protein